MNGLPGSFGALDTSASGLRAERARMDAIAQNIANAGSTRGPDGAPYRRREVLFEAVLDETLGAQRAAGLPPGSAAIAGGVRVSGVVEDASPGTPVYKPGHPDADERGFVVMPNVNLPFEMVDMVTASRAYEANLSALRSYKEMVAQALQIGR